MCGEADGSAMLLYLYLLANGSVKKKYRWWLKVCNHAVLLKASLRM
jgi:hypothetical protein